MKILSVFHNVYLTSEEILQLIGGQEVNVIGASLPVWFHKGTTSEPAEEVFCKYTLTNKINHESIKTNKNGYVINMPQTPGDYKIPVKLTNDEWRLLTPLQQMEWYENNPSPINAYNLNSIKDGGSEYLYFKEYSKVKRNNKTIMIIHTVEIRTVEWLKSTFNNL